MSVANVWCLGASAATGNRLVRWLLVHVVDGMSEASACILKRSRVSVYRFDDIGVEITLALHCVGIGIGIGVDVGVGF